MKGKILIVEDEPIVALDLQQEVQQLGCEVVGLAESADEALMAAEECRPDLALMDVRIVGSMDGIQAARLLRGMYQVPVVFLTSYSDEFTISRASREMPYGYLTKPFQSRDLKATLRVALHKAKIDANRQTAQEAITATIGSMREGLLTVSLTHEVQYMNAAAEELTGKNLGSVKGLKIYSVLNLSDSRQRQLPVLDEVASTIPREECGGSMEQASGARLLVDFSVTSLVDQSGKRTGFVVTLRDAAERLRSQAVEETFDEVRSFDQAPMAMVQLDEEGKIIRVNDALLQESGITADKLVGRSLTGLSMDPDPRIAKQLMHKLLQGGTSVTTGRARVTN